MASLCLAGALCPFALSCMASELQAHHYAMTAREPLCLHNPLFSPHTCAECMICSGTAGLASLLWISIEVESQIAHACSAASVLRTCMRQELIVSKVPSLHPALVICSLPCKDLSEFPGETPAHISLSVCVYHAHDMCAPKNVCLRMGF